MEIKKNNPWLGLTSYTEESLDKYQFNGRSAATATLVAMIENNLFVTLYGRSGIGKTSLLQAGVFPILRHKGMLPVTLRLNKIRNPKTDKDDAEANDKDIKPDNKSADSNPKKIKDSKRHTKDNEVKEADQEEETIDAAEFIWSSIVSEAQKHGFHYTQYSETDTYEPDFNDTLVLRNLFSAGEFVNKDGQRTIPLIALDQFEEILYNAPHAARKVILQLYALVDDNYNYAIMHPEWHDDTDFRIVISIREDDLFLLEDNIDILNCSGFRSNRYRLMPLSDKEAEEVILTPSEGIFNEEEIDAIAKGIISLVRQKGASINTLALSLLCYVLFEQCYKPGKPISADDLKGYSDILETYYIEATKGFTKGKKKRQLHYLEEKLIDSQGRRSYVYKSDFDKYAPDAKEFLEGSGKRLLNLNQDRVEYAHDQLAAAVSKIRNKRNQKSTRIFGTALLIIGLLVLFLYSFSQVPDLMSKDSILNIGNDNIRGNQYVTDISCSASDNFIADCPNLKAVTINDGYKDLHIFNCPSLTQIHIPDKFVGSIYVYNCPYIKKNKVIKEYAPSAYDSLYLSQLPVNRGNNTVAAIKLDFEDNKIIYYRLPFTKTSTLLPNKYEFIHDSLKQDLDCYVPYGTKDKFSQYIQFQPYRSLNETRIYEVWEHHLSGIWGYFKQKTSYLILSVLGICLVLIIFWIASFVKYMRSGESTISSFLKSIFSGIGMGLVALLSFMAAYWTVFNILVPWNQDIAVNAGVWALLISILLIYNNSFFSMRTYFKENGIRGFIRDTQDVFAQISKQLADDYMNIYKGRHKKLIVFTLMVIFVVIPISLYKRGQSQRSGYLTSLKELIDNEQYGKALSLIPAIEEAHKSFLYPAFTDSLESLKKKLDKDSLYLVAGITLDFLNKKAYEQGLNIHINKSYGYSGVSPDGSKITFLAELMENDDKKTYQGIVYNLASQTIDTITSRHHDSFHYYSSFTPSGNLIAASNKMGIWLTHLKTNSILKTSKISDTRSLVFLDDSTLLYSTSYSDKLYSLSLSSISNSTLIQDSTYFSGLYRIDDHRIAANDNYGKFIIYDLSKRKKLIHGKKHWVGSPRTVYLKSKLAITSCGLYDMFSDSLIVKNGKIYNFRGIPIEIRLEDGYFHFKDLKEKEILKIPLNGYDSWSNLFICKDQYLFNFTSDYITVYRISPKVEEKWPITDADRKLFNLPK